MDQATYVHRFVRFANTLLFACGLGLALDQSMAAALDRFDQVPHWRSDERSLVVTDRTGDRAWNDASRQAVTAWNESAGGTGLRLTWTTGTGPCTPEGNRIDICQDPYQTLGDDIHDDREGLADLRLGPDRSQAHIGGTAISVCSNCQLTPARRRVVATHELGHSLGLEHTLRGKSVMYPTGGSEAPDVQDETDLKQLYAHADEEDRCGLFDARLGALCF